MKSYNDEINKEFSDMKTRKEIEERIHYLENVEIKNLETKVKKQESAEGVLGGSLFTLREISLFKREVDSLKWVINQNY
jgi:hypothetical protein